MASRIEVANYLVAVLSKLDELSGEDWISESFIIDTLIIGSEDSGFTPDIGAVLYSLREMGEPQLAIDFKNWIDTQTDYAV